MTEQALQIDTEVRAALLQLRDKLSAELRARHPTSVSFRIGEVARWLGVGNHVLHHWESRFGAHLRPMRTATIAGTRPGRRARGRRYYSHKDAVTLGCIQHLLHVEMYTTAGALRQLRMARDAGGAS